MQFREKYMASWINLLIHIIRTSLFCIFSKSANTYFGQLPHIILQKSKYGKM